MPQTLTTDDLYLLRDALIDAERAHANDSDPALRQKYIAVFGKIGALLLKGGAPARHGAPSEDSDDTWLSMSEAAEYLKCGVKTLSRAVAEGKLRVARITGRRVARFRRAWLDAFVEAAAGGGGAPQ